MLSSDWEWGEKFLRAESKDEKNWPEESKAMSLIRIGSSMADRDPTRLPYLGGKTIKLDRSKGDPNLKKLEEK